ncbi:MAG: signal peptidase II [Candidatus Pelagibacter sp.]|tara:strand:+ start:577 stop:1086 length:510 start_codon:yes stop_codon:yes gene_type:complete
MNPLKFLSEKKFEFSKNFFTCFLLIIITFSIDRVSKIKIINHQIENEIIYINDYINFDLVWNTGIAFGFLSSNTSLVYNLITIIIALVIIFLIYLITRSSFSDKILFSLIIGGALGNFYDRYTYSAVPDFIDIHYKNFHWFTFNMADIFITIGIIILISKDLYFKNEKY